MSRLQIPQLIDDFDSPRDDVVDRRRARVMRANGSIARLATDLTDVVVARPRFAA
jgi:hypothetical protein